MFDPLFALVAVVLPYLLAVLVYLNWLFLVTAMYVGAKASIDVGFGDRAGMFLVGVVLVLADQLTAPVFGQDRIELLSLTAPAAHYTAAGYGFMLGPIVSYGIRIFRQKKNAVDSS
jgi:hypothetical protein